MPGRRRQTLTTINHHNPTTPPAAAAAARRFDTGKSINSPACSITSHRSEQWSAPRESTTIAEGTRHGWKEQEQHQALYGSVNRDEERPGNGQVNGRSGPENPDKESISSTWDQGAAGYG